MKCSDVAFVRDLLPALVAIQHAGAIQVVDIVLLTKTLDGAVARRELSDLDQAPDTEEDEGPEAEQAHRARGLVATTTTNT
ncbi:MAG TPA: hypothetical protein VMV29_16450, partial [Ktedonobacterales bacterium]|nr:hypothetical protein [Ktedonobacterales bacterium]